MTSIQAYIVNETYLMYSRLQKSVSEAKETGDRMLDASRKEAARMIFENDKYDHQCYLSVSELLKLRLRIMIAQREEMEELDRHNKFF